MKIITGAVKIISAALFANKKKVIHINKIETIENRQRHKENIKNRKITSSSTTQI